jgi:hypothetical protein
MNRRGFLQRAALAVAALAMDPEQLLWTPGKKTFFIPETLFVREPMLCEITIRATVSEYTEFITVSSLLDEALIQPCTWEELRLARHL